MEKTPMYTVVTPQHPCRRQWVAWAAAGVGVLALLAACVTAAVVLRQADRVTDLEEKVLEMQAHMEEILRFTIDSHDYLEYEDYANDSQLGPYEELTLQRVVRKKRQANSLDSSDQNMVPIFDESYGLDLRGHSEGFRLYQTLQATSAERDRTSPEVTVESTDSPIKPHHRVSGAWVSNKQSLSFPYITRQDESEDYEEVVTKAANRRPVLRRPSRTKSLHGSGGGVRMRPKERVQSNPNRVLFRDSLVKATSRHDDFSGPNSVAPKSVIQKVQQKPEFVVRTVQNPVIDSRIASNYKDGRKKKRPGTRQVHRRRRSRSITVAHYVATPFNRTSRHAGFSDTHDEWSAAPWMDKLGLNRKYQLRHGVVTVRESGLYYLYAQVLYEPGRSGTGFQIEVDGIPIMQCTMAPNHPSHSCYTAGATYLPRNADVYVRDLEHHSSTVKRQENSFFGLLKLRDAPNTAEELVLG